MDPISDMITIIKNGYLARKQKVHLPYSTQREKIAQKIQALGFLEEVSLENDKKDLVLTLRYRDGKPVVHDVKRISKPSLRIYSPAKRIPKVLGGRGEVILSTSKGILTGAEAKRSNLGGEILLQIW